MTTKPRIAVIGCGYWGANHVRTLADIGALAAISDRHIERADELAKIHNAPARLPDEILADDTIDGVVCALPADQHPVMAQKALEAGKHVLVEKPMALTTQDAKAVADLADAKGKVLMVGHILRYHTAFMAAMDVVQSGALGAIRHIQSHRLAFGKFHDHFDALWDLGPHDLSLIMAITGKGPKDVTSHRVVFANDSVDAAHVHMDFGGDLTAHIHVSRHSPYNSRRFVVTGTQAMLYWDDFADWPQKVAIYRQKLWKEGGKTQFSLSDPDYLDVAPGMALTDELAHFCDCITTGKTPLTSGRQAVDVIDILERAGAFTQASFTTH